MFEKSSLREAMVAGPSFEGADLSRAAEITRVNLNAAYGRNIFNKKALADGFWNYNSGRNICQFQAPRTFVVPPGLRFKMSKVLK